MTNSSDLKTRGSDVEIRGPISEMGTIVPIQSAQNIELVPFDEVDSEPVKVRSRLRLTAIMCGLYVRLTS
jgi:hypothetical protein